MDILIEEKEGSLWVAAIKNKTLYGLEIDPAYEEVRWGAIYYGRVDSIDGALDAAYINLDGDNTGILYNRDVRIAQKDGAVVKGGEKSIGQSLNPGQMVAVQAKTSYIGAEGPANSSESKLPVLSMDITLPGRYLIYCPFEKTNRISSRIYNSDLRKTITAMTDELSDIKGCIIRAAAANTQTEILSKEGRLLEKTWHQMKAHFTGDAPQLIMSGPDAIQRTLSDQADQQIDTVQVVVMDHMEMAEGWCSIFAPDLVPKIEPVELPNAAEDLALFDYRDIWPQIDELTKSYVKLPGGGNIILQETAALTAIDVNRGGDKRSHLAINLEAAKELARQMRLRNLGGIFIADFLKSQKKQDETQLLKVMKEAICSDPCTVQIHGMTKLGLMEITRKRRTAPLKDRF